MDKFLLLGVSVLCALTTILPAKATANPKSSEFLQISDGYLRAMPPGQTVTVGFLKVRNVSDRDCEITSAKSSISDRVEFHEHLHSDGMMRMRSRARVSVLAGETVDFKPGSLHLMLFDINVKIEQLPHTLITLQTDQCGSYRFPLGIKSLIPSKTKEHH